MSRAPALAAKNLLLPVLADPVLRRLIMPLVLMLSVLVLGFGSFNLFQQQQFLDERARHAFADVVHEWEHLRADQIRSMAAIQAAMLENPALREGLRRRDRQGLLARYADLLSLLEREMSIIHIYFHDAQRINIVRAAATCSGHPFHGRRFCTAGFRQHRGSFLRGKE